MQSTDSFQQLLDIMSRLRAKDGCPWDIEQTSNTIKGHLIEEAYEVVEAINNNDFDHLKEELGDLLLQIVFHSQIAKEDKKFDINDVIDEINKKLIRRHPHIFADEKVLDKKEVLKNWEEIKKQEKIDKGKNTNPSYLDGVPLGLPALAFSQRLQTKASRVGFDWNEIPSVIDKIDEEIEEFKVAVAEKDYESIEKELGDVFFSLVNLARKVNVDAESALMKSSNVFSKRFAKMEELSSLKGIDFAKLTLDEKENLWIKVKEVESGELKVESRQEKT